MTLKFQKLRPTAKLPTKGSEFSAGYDLYLAEDLDLNYRDVIHGEDEVVNEDRTIDVISTIEFDESPVYAKFGISVEIPEGYCGLLVERSSNCKRYISQANKIGIIDSDYRGELMAPYSREFFEPESDGILKAGERIAQLVIVPVFNGEPVWSEELTETDRGEGGFGSTGTN